MSLPRFGSLAIVERPIPPRVVVIHWAFAALLLVAAGLKAESLWGSVAPPVTANLVVTVVGVAVECFMAAWLLSGLAAAFARRAAILLLLTFICVASWRLANHVDDCGCFGRIMVHPAWTLAFDSLSLFSIWLFGRRSLVPLDPRHQFRVSPRLTRIATAFLACMFIASCIAAITRNLLSNSIAASSLVVLEPKTLIGKKFPLLNEISPPLPELARGQWSVLIIDHNCNTCMQFLRTYRPKPGMRSVIIDAGEGDANLPLPKCFRLEHAESFMLSGPTGLVLRDDIVQEAAVAP